MAPRRKRIERMGERVGEVQRAAGYCDEALVRREEAVGWREKEVEEREKVVGRREREGREGRGARASD